MPPGQRLSYHIEKMIDPKNNKNCQLKSSFSNLYQKVVRKIVQYPQEVVKLLQIYSNN